MTRLWMISALGAAACATAGHEQPDGAVPGPDAPLPIDAPTDMSSYACTSNDTCAAATLLGAVSGDTGTQSVQVSGTRAAWYRVRVTEDENGIGATPEKVRVTLTSPANADFAVFVYVNTGSDTLECSQTVGTTNVNGKVEQTNAHWGESGTFANGSDDSRDVSIEIRPVSGTTCAADQTWQLVVQGD